MPAAMRVLQQPAQLRRLPPGRAEHGRMDRRDGPGTRYGCHADRFLRRRAYPAQGPRDAGRRGGPHGLLQQPDHLRYRPDRSAPARAEGSRPTAHPARFPVHRPQRRAPIGRGRRLGAQAAHGTADQVDGFPHGAQRADHPAEHRPGTGHHRVRRRTGCRVSGAGQRAVLQLGAAQPRRPDAHPRRAAARRGSGAAGA